jgi:alpha-glucoside transport system substrate-binding protein
MPAAGATGAASPAAGATMPAGTPAAGTTGTPPASGTAAAGSTPSGATDLRDPEEVALEAADGEQLGGTVSVLGPWGGAEQESFEAMLAPFESATGVDVQYTGSRDAAAIMVTRVQGGDPPDIGVFANPGQMNEFANQDRLVNLAEVLDMDMFRISIARPGASWARSTANWWASS